MQLARSRLLLASLSLAACDEGRSERPPPPAPAPADSHAPPAPAPSSPPAPSTAAPSSPGAAVAAAAPSWSALGLDTRAGVAAALDRRAGVVVASYQSASDGEPASAEVSLTCAEPALTRLAGAIAAIAVDRQYERSCEAKGAVMTCRAAGADEYGQSYTLVVERTSAGTLVRSYEAVTTGVTDDALEPLRHARRQAEVAARAHGCRGGRGMSSVPTTVADEALAIPVQAPIELGHESELDGRALRWTAPGQVVVVRARGEGDTLVVTAEGRGAPVPLVTIDHADAPSFRARALVFGRALVLAATSSGSGEDPGQLRGWLVSLVGGAPTIVERFAAEVGGAPPPAWLRPAL